MQAMFVYGQELDTRTDIIRAGVIPFTVQDRKLYFLLGIDRRTRELTDFGGGVKVTDKGPIGGAYRELYEETCKIFGSTVTKEQLKHSLALTNQNTAIFFLRIESAWLDSAEEVFRACQEELREIKKYNELIGVKWVVDRDFELVAFNRRSQCMWKRIQNMLCMNTTWNELRLRLILGPELTNAVKNSWYCLSQSLNDAQKIVSQSCS
ncbi:hypothetical protein LCGC14_1671490 [marine sediment metagenome]|uniref:Nudix hydrolase domain-containing protein n=1 Tax=marine sediment metagenome TaxID=412755 RepID=A0A0F9HR80_9ZZZZ